MTKTKEKIQYLCWLLCLCLLSACSDSEKFPNHIPSEGTDGYEETYAALSSTMAWMTSTTSKLSVC